MGKILTAIATVVCIVASLVGCSSNTCRDNVSALPVAVFYSSSTQEPITVDSITVYGVGVPGDSAIVRNGRVAQVYLPLRGSVSECSYVFHYEQRLISNPMYNDTLTVRYNAVPVFTSAECGAMYFYEITDYACTDHLIDSVRLVNANVSNVEAETFGVYFRTADDEEDAAGN